MLGKKSLLVTLALLLVLVQTAAARGYGTSSISLTTSSATLTPGLTASTGYAVTLVSGSFGTTTLNIVNNSKLLSEGINVSLSVNSESPPFNGTMGVRASPNTTPSTYDIVLNATGNDPSVNNTTFVLTVSPVKQTTLSSTTTVARVTTVSQLSNASSGATSGGVMGGNGMWLLAVFGILVLLVIAYLLFLRGRKPRVPAEKKDEAAAGDREANTTNQGEEQT